MKACNYLICLLMMLLLGACSDNSNAPDTVETVWHEKKVVVILPQSDGMGEHWQRVFSLFSGNAENAFRGQADGIRLSFEYHDESTEDIDALAEKIATRDDVYAVIGGLYSSNASRLASRLCRNGITFLTLATTEELVRGYSGTGNLWAMTETDITQSEVLLSKVVNYGGKSVALLANGSDSYGKTFVDWFGFQAKELSLEVKGIYTYSDGDLAAAAARAMDSGADFAICVPSEVDDIAPMVAAANAAADAPRLLFSDMGYGSDVIERLGKTAEGIEGVCFGSDPETGFDVSFRTFFGVAPTVGAAQAYDAAMLLTYAAWYQHINPGASLRDALRAVVNGRDFNLGTWLGEDMRNVVTAIAKGDNPYVRGASGWLDFDSKVYTNVLATVYYNYKIYNGEYIILDYNTADGGNRTDATLAGWNWKASQMQDFGQTDVTDYAPHTSTRALLVATSSGWTNYRHQADVLALYQLLRRNGFSDENIVLVCADDIARNASNSTPGEIRVKPGGDNVYRNVEIDYRLADLSEQDICDILAGNRSERLPDVIDGDEGTNVFVFWSGHGEPGTLCWDDGTGITPAMMRATLEQMAEKRNYRKLCLFAETCFSGSVFEKCTGLPGMLFFTAAGNNETSKADVFNADMAVWMSNRFTSTFVESVSSDTSMTLSDLYTRLFINTVGSHVMVYNSPAFGNLYRNTITEFIQPR